MFRTPSAIPRLAPNKVDASSHKNTQNRSKSNPASGMTGYTASVEVRNMAHAIAARRPLLSNVAVNTPIQVTDKDARPVTAPKTAKSSIPVSSMRRADSTGLSTMPAKVLTRSTSKNSAAFNTDDIKRRVQRAWEFQREFESSVNEVISHLKRVERTEQRKRKEQDEKWARLKRQHSPSPKPFRFGGGNTSQKSSPKTSPKSGRRYSNAPSDEEIKDVMRQRAEFDAAHQKRRKNRLSDIMTNFEWKLTVITQVCEELMDQKASSLPNAAELVASVARTKQICADIFEDIKENIVKTSVMSLNELSDSTVVPSPHNNAQDLPETTEGTQDVDPTSPLLILKQLSEVASQPKSLFVEVAADEHLTEQSLLIVSQLDNKAREVSRESTAVDVQSEESSPQLKPQHFEEKKETVINQEMVRKPGALMASAALQEEVSQGKSSTLNPVRWSNILSTFDKLSAHKITTDSIAEVPQQQVSEKSLTSLLSEEHEEASPVQSPTVEIPDASLPEQSLNVAQSKSSIAAKLKAESKAVLMLDTKMKTHSDPEFYAGPASAPVQFNQDSMQQSKQGSSNSLDNVFLSTQSKEKRGSQSTSSLVDTFLSMIRKPKNASTQQLSSKKEQHTMSVNELTGGKGRRSIYHWIKNSRRSISKKAEGSKEVITAPLSNQNKWVPRDLLCYSTHVHSFSKGMMPFENDLENYMTQIQQRALERICEILEQEDMLNPSAIKKVMQEAANPKKASSSILSIFNKSKPELATYLPYESNPKYFPALEQVLDSPKTSEYFTCLMPTQFEGEKEVSLKLPALLRRCADFIKNDGILSQGVFRVSGAPAKVLHLKALMENSEQFAWPEDTSHHEVATLMKAFFRDLKETILPEYLSRTLLAAVNVEDYALKLELFQCLMTFVPRAHISTLFFLFSFLSHVASYSDSNSMTCNNLAVVFAPNLMKYPELEAYGMPGTQSTSDSNASISDACHGLSLLGKKIKQKKKLSKQEEIAASQFAGSDATRFMIENYNAIFQMPASLVDKVVP